MLCYVDDILCLKIPLQAICCPEWRLRVDSLASHCHAGGRELLERSGSHHLSPPIGSLVSVGHLLRRHQTLTPKKRTFHCRRPFPYRQRKSLFPETERKLTGWLEPRQPMWSDSGISDAPERDFLIVNGLFSLTAEKVVAVPFS